MSRDVAVPRLLLVAVSLVSVFASTSLSAAGVPRAGVVPARITTFDPARRIDAGDLNFWQSNVGSFGFRVDQTSAGLFYPRGAQTSALFAGGLWVGAKVGGQVRATVAEYGAEYGPGTSLGLVPSNPLDPRFIVYKMARWTGNPQDSAHVSRTPAELAAGSNLDPLVHHSWSEYVNGAGPFGAPVKIYRLPATSTPAPNDSVDIPGPDVRGDQMTWCVFNDADPANHQNNAGDTPPLGIQVVQTSWTYSGTGVLGSTVFTEYKIINRGPNTLQDLVVSLWTDPDLGGFSDDLVGCDTTRSLAYCYNATNTDASYGATPPAVGLIWLQGPITGGDTLGLSSFNRYVNGTDPGSAIETYNYMLGLTKDGQIVIDPTTGSPTRYPYSGDPVGGTGWRDTSKADKRMMMSSGTVTMAPGDAQIVVAALIVAPGLDRLSSLTSLKYFTDFVREFHATGQISDLPPNLRLVRHDIPRRLQGCGPFDARLRVVNTGSSSGSFAFRWTVGAASNPIVLLDETPGGLPAGEALDRSAALTLLPGQNRPFDVEVVDVDYFYTVPESDENDNFAFGALQHAVPVITSLVQLTPVPNAQARIRFLHAPGDSSVSTEPITQYEIYRRIDLAALRSPGSSETRVRQAREAGMTSTTEILLAGWDFVTTLPAHAESEYSVVVPLLAEQPTANGSQSFMVRAATANPLVFWDSCTDSMPQSDTLPPPVPQNFHLTVTSPQEDVKLTWDAVAAPDFRHYRVYRSSSSAFLPGPSTLIATLTSTQYLDSGAATGGPLYYRVGAVDWVGNVGATAPAGSSAISVEPETPPLAFAFRRAVPNPARGTTRIGFDLPVAAHVRLTLYDVAGRAVRHPFDSRVPAGRRDWSWDGRDDRGRALPPGVYLIRFEAGSFRATDRILLLD